MKTTKIISGFPGIGKTVLAKSDYVSALDSDSSSFSFKENGDRDPNFPNNYIEHIIGIMGKYDYIFVSSHDLVRSSLKDNGIKYTIVYPSIELKDEYLKRYKERGNDEKFISFIDGKWNDFIKDIEAETHPNLIKLDSSMFLSDVL